MSVSWRRFVTGTVVQLQSKTESKKRIGSLYMIRRARAMPTLQYPDKSCRMVPQNNVWMPYLYANCLEVVCFGKSLRLFLQAVLDGLSRLKSMFACVVADVLGYFHRAEFWSAH